MFVYKMAKIEKEEVECPVCHCVTRGVSDRLQHLIFYLIFNFIIYISQMCKYDCTILWICRALVL